jgi:hypothetical protein
MFCTKHHILNSNSAKHIPLFICCEKYIFDNTKSDAFTDFVLIAFSQHIYMFCTKHHILNPYSAKHFPWFICCEKYIFDNTKTDAITDSVLIVLFITYLVKL